MDRAPEIGAELAPHSVAGVRGLYPIWVGFALAGCGLGCSLLGKLSPHLAKGAGDAQDAFFGIGVIYYFVAVYGIAKVLREQSGWWQEYTPWGIVWRQFVPLHGLWVLFRWLESLQTYVRWRTGVASNFGRWVFGLLIVGFFCYEGPVVGFVGQVLTFGALTVVYQRLEQALMVPEPGGSMP